jgi:hypothetical protein
MLDPKVIELVDRMVRVQFEERETQLGREILQEKYREAKSGGPSSVTVDRVYDLCSHDIGIRTQIVWQNLVRVLSQTGIVASETLGEELKTVVRSYHSSIYNHPFQSLQAASTNFAPRRPLTDAWERAVMKIEAEIDFFVLSLLRHAEAKGQQPGSPQPVFHFHSPVGAIQTGPGATANVVQNLAAQDKEALRRALDLVRDALSDVDDFPGNPKAEIVELVAEAESEVGKPSPNQTRLRSILTAVASVIQTVGSLQPAYQALKVALLPLGIALP